MSDEYLELKPDKLRSKHLFNKIKIKQKISEVGNIKTYVKVAAFYCCSCEHMMYLSQKLNTKKITKPKDCEECSNKTIRFEESKSSYIDIQRIILDSGLIGYMLGDAVDSLSAGDEAFLCGELRPLSQIENSEKRISEFVIVVDSILTE